MVRSLQQKNGPALNVNSNEVEKPQDKIKETEIRAVKKKWKGCVNI